MSATLPSTACKGFQTRRLSVACRDLWPNGQMPAWYGPGDRNRDLQDWFKAKGIKPFPSDRHLRRVFNSNRTLEDTSADVRCDDARSTLSST